MPGISQTIPNFNGGISEQPDQLKLPGQVKNAVNVIPDIINGLYKRPGSKRIGGSPLANIQSSGSWFHYYRDDVEGCYLGQVAADGKIRMWCTKDLFNASGTKVNSAGDEIFVHYDTVSGAYTQSNYDASDSDHTAITTYLSASDTEDVQALTINDSTFLNNRDTTVATTGTTDGRPHSHFAFVEILRTENGRQYAMNVYSNETTTNLTRATRLKVESDTLEEGNGSGHCAGIGTQVFGGAETNETGKYNLTFRLTILGQQGQGRNRTNTGSSEDFCCTYNRDVTLLHGGEGWDTDDERTVTLDQANGGDGTYNNEYNVDAQYTIKVTDHETIATKGFINGGFYGVVRPAPTPFDADTAVTIDTVIGGIIDEFNGTGVTVTQIGNGFYLHSSSAFQVEVLDNDLMRVMQGTVNDVANLPIQCKDGYIVKVANARMSDEDDYYLKFNGTNGVDGPGVWEECAKPSIVKSFNANTMPHVLQRQSISGSNPVIFLVKKYGWKDRDVGDDVTNALPSFVGNKINRVKFFRNRLVFLSGENVICSRPGTLGEPDWFAATALTVGATDPVDIACSSNYPSSLFDAIEITSGLLCFSSNQQFLLAADDTVFNPDTAKLRSVSSHNYNKILPPIYTGLTVGFVDSSHKYSRFVELADVKREGEPTLVTTSTLIPTALSKDVNLITNSRENNLVFFGIESPATNSDTVVGYRYFRTGNTKPLQSAWFKWKFNNPIKYHFAVEDEYFYVDSDDFFQKINLVQADADPSIDQDDVNYLIHLDNYTTIRDGVFDDTTNLTTFSNVSWIPEVTTPNGQLVLVDTDSNTAREGRYVECTLLGNNPDNDFTVTGNWDYNRQLGIYKTSINTSTEVITSNDHGLSTADEIRWIAGPTTAGGLTNNTLYYIIKVDDNSFKLATSSANATAGTAINITSQGDGTHYVQVPISSLYIGYLYDYQVEFPRIYLKQAQGDKVAADTNSKITVHRLKLNFGKVGLYETSLTRVGKPTYTEVYECTDLDEYLVSDAPYLAEVTQDVPVYENSKNVDITLKSTHPSPATLHSMSWEGEWSPMHYQRG